MALATLICIDVALSRIVAFSMNRNCRMRRYVFLLMTFSNIKAQISVRNRYMKEGINLQKLLTP